MAKSGMSKANGRQNTRHKVKYQAYRNSERTTINKIKRTLKHCERNPNDVRATDWLRLQSQAQVKQAKRELEEARQ